MNNEAIKLLFEALSADYDLGTVEEFTAYLMDEKKRKLFYEQVIAPNYDVESLEMFEQAYGLKKKDNTDPFGAQEPTVSPTQESLEPTFSDSSNEPSSPTAPIDPTTGLPYQEEETTRDTTEVEMIDYGSPQEDFINTESTTKPRDQTTEAYGGGDFLIEGSQEDNTLLENIWGKNSVTDFIGDIYRAGKQGFIQGNTVDEATDLMLSGADATDEEILEFLSVQERLESLGQTDEMLNFNKIYDKADNKGVGFLQGLSKNPSVIFQLAAQTITQLLNPDSLKAAGVIMGAGAVAAGSAALISGVGAAAAPAAALKGAVSPVTLRWAFAAASATLETGLSFGEFLREEAELMGKDFDEDGIRAVLNNPAALSRARLKSVARGGTIGIIDRLALGLGGKIVKSMKPAATASKQFRKEMGVNLATEMVGGGVGESAARAVAGQEQDVRDIGFETIGGIGRAPVSYAINKSGIKEKGVKAAGSLFRAITKKAPIYTLTDNSGETITRTKEEIDFIIDDTDDETFMGLNIKIDNDPEVKARYDDRKMHIITGDNIRQKLREAGLTNEDQINEIVELEIEKNKYEGNNTEAGKKKLKEIKEKIAELSGVTDADVTPVVQPKTDKTDAVQDPNMKQNEDGTWYSRISDNQVPVKTEEFTVTTTDGEIIIFKARTSLDGKITWTKKGEGDSIFVPATVGMIGVKNAREGLNVYEKAGDKVEVGKIGDYKGVMNPKMWDKLTQKQKEKLDPKRAKLTKKTKQDAIQESSTESVDVQEPTESSSEVGVGDNISVTTPESESQQTPEGEQTTEVVEESQTEIDPDAPIEGKEGRTVRQIANDIFVEEQKLQTIKKDRIEIESNEEGIEALFGAKFSRESLRRYFGNKGKLTDFIGRRYIAKKGDPNAVNIEDGFEVGGRMLDQNEIINFISEFNTQEDINNYFGDNRIDLNNFKAEFEEATGLKPTKKNIQKFINMAEVDIKEETVISEGEEKSLIAEDVDLINEIETKILSGLNQGFKKGITTIRKFLKTLKNDGRISNTQIGKILEKVTNEDAYKDEGKRQQTIDEIKKIFKEADIKSEQSSLRTKAKRAAKNLKRSIGRIIKDAISGKDITLESSLRQVVVIDPTAVPAKVYQDFKDIINSLGERDAGLLDNADEAGIIAEKARNVLKSMVIQESRILELQSIFDASEKVLFKNGKIDYKKTIENLLKDEQINEEDVDLMNVYKKEINPKEQAKPKTEEEIQQEKEKFLAEIDNIKIDKNRVDEKSDSSFPFLKTREDIREFTKLIKDKKILEGMNNTDLKHLTRVANTINNGYAPGILSRLITKMKAVRDSTPIAQDIKENKLKLPTIEGMYSKLKTFNPFNKQSKFYNALERGQLYNIDRLFGDFKTKKIFNALFDDMAVEQQQFEVNNKKDGKLRDKVRKLLDKAYSKLGVVASNAVAAADARLMFYRIQLEYESNPENKEVRPAIEWLDATIKYLEANRKFDKQDAREIEVLKKIREDYIGDTFSLDNIYKKFKTQEIEALKILQEIDNNNTGKAVYAANNRDAAFVARQNYVHISVRPKSRERIDINKDVIDNFIKSTDSNRRPSTKSKSGIERTGNVSPIYTSAINASERGSKFTNLDFYMTTPVRKSKQTFKALKEKLINDYDGSPPKEVQAFLDSLEKATNKAIQNVLAADFVDNDFMQMVGSSLQRLGYRTMLASAPRAGWEYLSNMMFPLMHPITFASGISKKNKLNAEQFLNVLTNLKSKVITRLTGDSLMSSKIDVELLNKKSYKGERFVSKSKEKIVGLWDATGKKFKNAVALIADTLISSPDKMVMKPMYLGKLSEKFKEITGKEIDYQKIADNDEAYMVENKEALEQAENNASEFSSLIGSTNNPFMGRLQGKDAKGLAQLFYLYNNFMTTFLKQEYDTSVIGLQALAQTNNSSSITRKEGAQLLAAVTLRMTAYSLGMKVGGELLLEMFGIESEDEEKDFDDQVTQSLATTFTSLIVGRNFGNVFKTIENYNIEMLNAEYGGGLRSYKEYDQYRDAIQYNVIPLANTGKSYKQGQGMDFGRLAPNFLGPYSPPVKTLAFTIKKLTESDRKTPIARERQIYERNWRIPIEILGSTGFVPLYKDVRKVLLADIYKDIGKKEPGVYSKKELEKLKRDNPRKYKKVMYDKKVERYDRAYKKYIQYKRNPGQWKRANPGKRKPTRPKRPR